MSLPQGLTKRVPLPFVRALAVLGGLAVFYTAASLFEPDPSAATPVRSAAAPSLPGATSDDSRLERLTPRTTPALIGTLSGAQYAMDVYMTPSGARYTVKDLSGKVLADQITSDDLYRSFPDLDVDRMHADVQHGDPLELD